MQNLSDQFTVWVASQPADEQYDYFNECHCACGQFFTFIGLAEQVNRDDPANDGKTALRDRIETRFMEELIAHPRTFGQLAARLEATQSGLKQNRAKVGL